MKSEKGEDKMKRRLKGLGSGLVKAVAYAATVVSLASAAHAAEIRYWDFVDPAQDNPRGRAIKQDIAEFQALNPGITVKVEVFPWHQLSSQLMQAAAAGRTPDVVRVLGWNVPDHVAAQSIASMNEFTDKMPESYRNDFVTSWGANVYDGNKVAIPLELRSAVLYYRKDLLDKVGRPIPKSIDEMIATGKLLSALPNTQGLVMGLSRSGDAVAFIEPFMSYLWAAGGDLVDKDGKPTFNSEAGVKVVKKIKEMIDSGAMSRASLGYGYDEVYSGIRSGTNAMSLLGSHRLVTAREAGKFGNNLLASPLPGFTADKAAPAHVFGWQLVIGKDSKHKAEAWKFIEYMTSTKAQVRRAGLTGELPTRKSAYDDPFFKTPEAQEIRDWLTFMASDTARSPHYPRGFAEMSQLIADAVQQVVVSNADPKQALDKAAERYSALRK
jgi:multiple sugar transport system substrate-binding protein